MTTYHWLRIRSAGRTWVDEHARLMGHDLNAGRIWGAFHGLFGLASNELMLITQGDGRPPVDEVTAAGFEVVEAMALVPTVRPRTPEPVSEPGLYVFRFFDVANRDVDEVARLSEEAWAGFENSDRYAAEAKALFAPAEPDGPDGVMLLVTWYDGFESWQASRHPSPDATANFRRRRALTNGTIAYATRLAGT